jgi:ABC-type multidrug transport system fused ATPase/permease subunit
MGVVTWCWPSQVAVSGSRVCCLLCVVVVELRQASLERLRAGTGALAGVTTLAVAHRLSTVQHADVILVFEKGAMVQSGSHAALMADKAGVYCVLVTAQALT